MSTRRPRLLDLFAGAGGAGEGYRQAGFEVTGVDIEPHAYPCGDFIQADAMEVLADCAFLDGFDVIHASPPCQAYSVTANSHDAEWPELIEPVRTALEAWGGTYVIENVPGAPLRNAVTLCGTEFSLTAIDVDGTTVALRRHRIFESNAWLMGAGGCRHDRTPVAGVYTGSRHRTPAHRDQPRLGGYTPARPVQEQLMGIDWMTPRELAEAIPPAYTEWIGAQLLDAIEVAA